MTSTEYAEVIQDATAWVDAYIFPNSVDSSTDADVLEAYRRAICAVIACGIKYPSLGVKSYTTGKVHEELESGEYGMLESAVDPYLSGSGLLCRWL